MPIKITSNSDPRWLLKCAEDQAATAPKTYKIADDRIPWLQKQVDRLNKLVASINKRGSEFGASQMQPIQIKVVNDKVQIKSKTKEDIFYTGKEVQVIGSTPQIKGWQFVASIMPLVDEQGVQSNVVKAVPGAGPVPEKYRTSVPKCDYCKQNRRRNETYVLRNTASGEFKEIGRNCLAKFLNTSSPEGIADLAEAFAGLQETLEGFENELMGDGDESGVRGTKMVPIGSFMANVIAVVRAAGFLGRSKAREEGRDGSATADLVWRYMDPKERDTVAKIIEKNTGKKIEHRPEDVELAKKVIQWARDLKRRAPESLNDYLGAVAAVGSSAFVPQKLIGYAASIPSAFQRQEATRGFFKGKVIKKDTTETGSTAWTFKDEAGKEVVWFDSEHVPDAVAMLDKAMADKTDVYFNGTFEKSGSFSGQGLTQANVERFLDQKQYEDENKEAIARELAAQEKLKSAPPLAPQGKAKMTLTVDKIRSIESQYGTKVKYEMTDDYGRKFFWMTTSSQELQEGQTYEANVTIGWEKIPGQNKPLLDAEGKRSLAHDKFTNAIRLEKVVPLSVGGQALVSGDDINSLNKQIRKLDEESKALDEQIRVLSMEKYHLLDQAGAPTSTDTNPTEELEKTKQVLSREIQRAMAAPQDQEFAYSFEGASHYLGYKFGELRYRDITPEEALKEVSVIRARNQQAIEGIKTNVPQAEELFRQWATAMALARKGDNNEWSKGVKAARQLKELLSQVEHKFGRYNDENSKAGITIELPSVRREADFWGEDDIKRIIDFLSNPKANFGRLDALQAAAQSGAMDIKKLSPPDGIEFRKHNPVLPARFVEAAQKVLASISQAEAQLPIIMQKLTPLVDRKKSLDAQSREIGFKRDEMEESRRRGKARTSAWVASIIKKS